MALNKLEQDTVSRGFQSARKVIQDIKPILDELDISWNAAGGIKETIDQAELDEIASFSGLTTVQLADGMYALTVGLKGAITNAYAQLVQLSSRA